MMVLAVSATANVILRGELKLLRILAKLVFFVDQVPCNDHPPLRHEIPISQQTEEVIDVRAR